MMSNQKCLATWLLLVFLFLSGCGITTDTPPDTVLSSEFQLPNIGLNDILALVGNHLICSNILENGDIKYQTINLVTGKSIECGTIQKHLLNNNSNILKDNTVYFRVTTASDDGTAQIDNFCKLDLKRNQIEVLSTKETHQSLGYLALLGDTFLSTTGFIGADGKSKTTIEQIDSNGKTQREVKAFWANRSSHTGEAMTNITAYRDAVYALVQRFESGEIATYIHSYSLSGEEMSSLNMQSYSTDFFYTPISDFTIVGNYIYMENFSGESIFGKIADGEFHEISGIRESLILAQTNENTPENLLFYNRESNAFFLFDPQSDTMTEKKIPLIPDNQNITFLLKSGELLVACTMDSVEGIESSTYTIQMSDLIPAQ